jgi:putative ABC transport system ATP-binding protein
MIRIDRVCKTYGQGEAEVRALDGVSMEIEDGEFLSIMGASGSGKSTLLHLLGGLDAPSSGEIFIAGRPMSKMSDDEVTIFRRRKIGFVFQFFNLLPTLSAEENVALPLLLDHKRMKEVRPRVERMLDLVGLRRRREHKPDQLSGGEMQRVAIARALVIEPILLLADEPTGNLDSHTGEEILHLIKSTAEQLKLTIVMVTHDPKAAAYGDRIITVKDGAIASDDNFSMRMQAAR